MAPFSEENKIVTKQWVDYIAKQLAEDSAESDMVDDLVHRGIDKKTAQEFVRHVATHELHSMSKAGKKAAPKSIIFGIILLMIGIALTVLSFTYSMIEGSGRIIICYGAILAGIVILGHGIWKMRW